MDWYILQTKPNGHKLAQDHLHRQNFKVFLPLFTKTSKRGTKFINRLKPLFPGYIFLGTRLDNIPWKSINSTRGVAKAVTLDGQYRSVASEILDGLRSRCNQNGVLETMNSVKIGDRVRIETGPFADFICNVEKLHENNRALVLLDLLQQQIRTNVSLNNLALKN